MLYASKLECGSIRFSTTPINDSLPEILVDRIPESDEICDIINGKLVFFKKPNIQKEENNKASFDNILDALIE